MDSMMAVEIRQTLEREFDIFLTAQDIRTLTFAKLKEMTDSTEQRKTFNIDTISTSNSEGLNMMIRIIEDSDVVPNILLELDTKKEIDKGVIFLLPGIEGCSSVYKFIAPEIKFPAICLQHRNIPESHSVVKSAVCLLPVRLKLFKILIFFYNLYI